MRLLDEKGRLFGKINIIDFAVVLFLFCLTPMFYFGYKIFHKPVNKPSLQAPKLITLDLYCKITDLAPAELNHISVGDILLDDSGNNIGEVLNVGEPAIYSYNIDLGAGEIISHQDPARRQVLIKIRILGEIRNNAFYYKGEKISIGSRISLKTAKYRAEGIVEAEPKSMYIKSIVNEKVLLRVEFKNLIPELADLINIDDDEKDEKGDTISRVQSIVTNKASEISIQNNGEIMLVPHPINRDIVLLIEARCARNGDKLFLKNNAVKIGSSMLFTTNKYDIAGTLIAIQTLEK